MGLSNQHLKQNMIMRSVLRLLWQIMLLIDITITMHKQSNCIKRNEHFNEMHSDAKQFELMYISMAPHTLNNERSDILTVAQIGVRKSYIIIFFMYGFNDLS